MQMKFLHTVLHQRNDLKKGRAEINVYILDFFLGFFFPSFPGAALHVLSTAKQGRTEP